MLRAVRIRDDVSLAAYPLLLDGKRIQMIRVDFRNQQRHVGLHPMAAGIADHGQTRLCQVHFDLFGDIARKTGECEVAIQSGLQVCTVSPATDSGIGVSSIHLVAWAYFFPAELSDAATAETSNQG